MLPGRSYCYVALIMYAMALSDLTAFAADSYRVQNGTCETIDEHGTCRGVTNNHTSGNDLLAPTKTSNEWGTFYNNAPSGVTINTCSGGDENNAFLEQSEEGTWVSTGFINNPACTSGGCPSDFTDPCTPGDTCSWNTGFGCALYECQQTTVCGSYYGVIVENSCWMFSSLGGSCTDRCASVGGVYDEATRTYAGSDGNNSNCKNVLDALYNLGSGTPTATSTNAGAGCYIDDPDYNRYRNTSATTSSAAYPGIYRACACRSEVVPPSGCP